LPAHRSQARRKPRRFRSGVRSSWWSRCCACSSARSRPELAPIKRTP
jgi:hypothetical protein